jgi:hypothetical protein
MQTACSDHSTIERVHVEITHQYIGLIHLFLDGKRMVDNLKEIKWARAQKQGGGPCPYLIRGEFTLGTKRRDQLKGRSLGNCEEGTTVTPRATSPPVFIRGFAVFRRLRNVTIEISRPACSYASEPQRSLNRHRSPKALTAIAEKVRYGHLKPYLPSQSSRP